MEQAELHLAPDTEVCSAVVVFLNSLVHTGVCFVTRKTSIIWSLTASNPTESSGDSFGQTGSRGAKSQRRSLTFILLVIIRRSTIILYPTIRR